MNLTSPAAELVARPRPTPAGLLGADHPLVRDLERLAVTRRHSLVVGAVLVGGIVELAEGWTAARAVVVAAVVMEVLLACRAMVLFESTRRHVLDVIADGRASLPIRAVERTCVRLRRPRHRRRLGQSVDGLLSAQIGGFDVVTTPWRFMRADLIEPVRRELIEIVALLRDDDAGLSGIAMLQRLLTDGTSSLHGDDLRRVGEDLGRVRFLLGVR